MRAAAAVGLAVSGGGKGTTAAGTVGSRSELGPGRTAAARCFSLLCGPGRTEAPSGGHSCFTSTAADGVGIGGGRGRGCGVTVTPVTAGAASIPSAERGVHLGSERIQLHDGQSHMCLRITSVAAVHVKLRARRGRVRSSGDEPGHPARGAARHV